MKTTLTTLAGNPHIHTGPQIADPDLINDDYVADEGITDHTMILSELARNTEATLAVAFELLTANLLSALRFEMERAQTRITIEAEAADQINARLGLTEES